MQRAAAAAAAAAAGTTGDDVKTPEGFTPEQQKKFNDAIATERRKQETKYRKELGEDRGDLQGASGKQQEPDGEGAHKRCKKTWKRSRVSFAARSSRRLRRRRSWRRPIRANSLRPSAVLRLLRRGGGVRRSSGPCRMPPSNTRLTALVRS